MITLDWLELLKLLDRKLVNEVLFEIELLENDELERGTFDEAIELPMLDVVISQLPRSAHALAHAQPIPGA